MGGEDCGEILRSHGDASGWLTPAEYETTKPKPAKKKKCAC